MLYDISQTLAPGIDVFPGDSPLTREVLMDMRQGSHLTLSTLRTTVHVGTHADAPIHYSADGRDMAGQPLDVYLGRAQVIRVARGAGLRVGVDAVLRPGVDVREARVLIDTGTFDADEKWNDAFAGLEPALVDALHERGVRLVGVDTPSVDPMTSKQLEAHKRFLAHDMAILEGLVLRDVPEGNYELIALPLKLVGFDGSPVRAVLRPLPS